MLAIIAQISGSAKGRCDRMVEKPGAIVFPFISILTWALGVELDQRGALRAGSLLEVGVHVVVVAPVHKSIRLQLEVPQAIAT